MVHHTVAEIRRENLAQLRAGGKEADRTAGAVSALLQRFLQVDQVLFLLDLEAQGVDGVALVAPAVVIPPALCHFTSNTNHDVGCVGRTLHSRLILKWHYTLTGVVCRARCWP